MDEPAPVPLTALLARYAVSTRLDLVPEDVRERARIVLVDELASACYGAGCTAGALAARYATSLGGPGESRILGTALRAPAQHAALANGTAGHADELDGAHVVGGHPGATIVHATAAAAQARHATGADLLNAVVLGYDVGNRLIRACGGIFGVKTRFHVHADLLHAVGASVAVSRLLGLDATRHAYAMALATFQAGGFVALFRESRHLSKSFCNGQYASAAVGAALMAATGLEGCEDVLGAPDGLLAAWGAPDGAQVLLDGLGSRFEVMGANVKLMNAGYPIHAAVEAALALMRRDSLRAQEIEAVEVGMPTHAMRVVDDRAMHNICLQDMLAVALLRREAPVAGSPFPQVLADPEFARLRALVRLDVDPELERTSPDGRGARVRITAGGSTSQALVEAPRGHSSRGGATWDDLRRKWTAALPGRDVERMLALGQRVEELDDANRLVEAFADGPALSA